MKDVRKESSPRLAIEPIEPSPTRRPEDVSLGIEKEWRRAAELAITVLARQGEPFTSADLVKLVGRPPSASLLPSLVRAAHLSALIQKSDRAPVGTVWIGVKPDQKPMRRGAGRRKTDEMRLPRELWQKAHDLAVKEKVPTGEMLIRALRAYLKKS